MEFTKYEVGQRVLSPCQDGVTFDLTDSGALLVIHMRNLTTEETQAFKQALAFRSVVHEGVIFVLVRMGSLQWMDAPYYRWRSRNLTEIELPGDSHSGLAVHAMLVEATTGVLVAQKLVGMDNATSVRILEAAREQPEIPDYNARLARIYAQYSTEELLKKATKK